MLDTDYRKKNQQQDEKEAWPVRLTFGVFAILFWSGVVAAWKFIGHDSYLIVSVIIPLGILAIILSLATLTATRRTARDFIEGVLSLLYFWS